MAVLPEQEVVVKELLFLRRQESRTMKNKILYIILILFATQFTAAQKKEPETLSELLKMYNERSVPYISVQELNFFSMFDQLGISFVNKRNNHNKIHRD